MIGTCWCGAVTTTTVTDLEAFASRSSLSQITGSCGHRHSAKPVRGKVGARECSAWCWDGTGRSCVCQCGGKNHGTAYAHLGATGSDR